MRLLLDTQALLYCLFGDRRLSRRARSAIIHPGNQVWVSVASAWEISIKKALGKVSAPDGLEQALVACGFATLPITLQHTEEVAGLPHHHRDPFDRMLVVQARAERMSLVTSDRALAAYDVELFW